MAGADQRGFATAIAGDEGSNNLALSNAVGDGSTSNAATANGNNNVAVAGSAANSNAIAGAGGENSNAGAVAAGDALARATAVNGGAAGAGAVLGGQANAVGDDFNALALAARSGSTANADGTTPTCTGNLSAAAQTNDGAFWVNFFGFNVTG